jgi:RNA-directed DNA polymerase
MFNVMANRIAPLRTQPADEFFDYTGIDQQCRAMRHWLLREQHQRLCRMLKGHYAYYGITGNYERLASLYEQARRNWRKWLSRRSNNSPVGWAVFERVLEHLPLPRPRIVRRNA